MPCDLNNYPQMKAVGRRFRGVVTGKCQEIYAAVNLLTSRYMVSDFAGNKPGKCTIGELQCLKPAAIKCALQYMAATTTK